MCWWWPRKQLPTCSIYRASHFRIIWKTVHGSTWLHSFLFVLFRYSSPKLKRLVSILFLFKTIWKHVVFLLMWNTYFFFHFKVTFTGHICFSENNLHIRRRVSNSISQKPQFFLNNKNIRISWNFFISFHLHFFSFCFFNDAFIETFINLKSWFDVNQSIL